MGPAVRTVTLALEECSLSFRCQWRMFKTRIVFKHLSAIWLSTRDIVPLRVWQFFAQIIKLPRMANASHYHWYGKQKRLTSTPADGWRSLATYFVSCLFRAAFGYITLLPSTTTSLWNASLLQLIKSDCENFPIVFHSANRRLNLLICNLFVSIRSALVEVTLAQSFPTMGSY